MAPELYLALGLSGSPHHVAGVRAHFLDQVRPAELEAIAAAFARIDDAFGPEGRCPGS